MSTYSLPCPKMGGGSFVGDCAYGYTKKRFVETKWMRVLGYAPLFFLTFFSFLRVLGYAPHLFLFMLATVHRFIMLLNTFSHGNLTWCIQDVCDYAGISMYERLNVEY